MRSMTMSKLKTVRKSAAKLGRKSSGKSAGKLSRKKLSRSGVKSAGSSNGRSHVKSLPPRSKVRAEDCWDLSSLFKSEAEWEKAFEEWAKAIPGYEKFGGKLGESAATLAACLNFDADIDRKGERLGTYASLRTTEDQGNSEAQRMKGRFEHVAAKAAEAASWVRPELMEIPAERM